MATTALNDQVQSRASVLFREHQEAIFRRTDRLFASLMIIQWFAGIAAAFWISPRTWMGAQSQTHIHVWTAIFLGGAISSFPIYLALKHAGKPLTRYVIAVAQMLTSALLIHLTGGRIETHFHVFGSLAFLACYRDWKVLVPASAVVAIDHGLRGFLFPQSVYGIVSPSTWRWLEHSLWVLFEDGFLIIAIRQSVQEMWENATQHARLEASNDLIESHNKKLQDYGRQAEAASRAKGEFLANMSHEIRTPMTAILGFTDLLQEGLCKPEEAIATIRRNGEHLVQLLNDILDLSKIEADKLRIEQVPCSPRKVIGEVAELMRVRADERNLALGVEYGPSIPDVIHTDPTRFRQILLNLVGNALKFTESGAVKIIARLADSDAADAKLEVQVVDTGIGISPQLMTNLFRPFVQADSSTTRGYGGTGLGLAICKRLAPMLGGDITGESQPGKGSRFTLTISIGNPVGAISCSNAADRDQNGHPIANIHSAGCYMSGRILLIEDSLDVQTMISHLLTQIGSEVCSASNGKEGVRLALAASAEGKPFDLILMDMQMPVMDGYTATRQLRENEYAGPIVAVTSHAMAGDREKCLEAGCDDYITKPIAQQDFMALVQRHRVGVAAVLAADN